MPNSPLIEKIIEKYRKEFNNPLQTIVYSRQIEGNEKIALEEGEKFLRSSLLEMKEEIRPLLIEAYDLGVDYQIHYKSLMSDQKPEVLKELNDLINKK